MAYNPAKNVWENEGGYTDWSAFDPSQAAASGMSPTDIINMAQNAGLGTTGPVFGGQNNIPSEQARNIFSSQWFNGLDPNTQQQLKQSYQQSHSDNGWGAFATALAIPAAFMGGPILSSLGSGGSAGAAGAGAAGGATGAGVGAAGAADAGAMDAAITGMSVPGASLGGAGAAAGGGGLLGAVNSAGKSILGPINQFLGTNMTTTGVLGAGLNYLQSQKAASNLKDVMNQAIASGNTLNQPQRAQYQGELSTMMANPQSYMENNPFAQALTAQYKNNVIPRNIAATGNAGNVIDQSGSQFATALSQNYNTLAQTLGQLGGFNSQAPFTNPSVVGELGTGAAAQQSAGLSGLGTLLGSNIMKNNPMAPAQGTSGTTGLFGGRTY